MLYQRSMLLGKNTHLPDRLAERFANRFHRSLADASRHEGGLLIGVVEEAVKARQEGYAYFVNSQNGDWGG